MELLFYIEHDAGVTLSVCTCTNPEKQFNLREVFHQGMFPKTVFKEHLKIDFNFMRSSMQMNRKELGLRKG